MDGTETGLLCSENGDDAAGGGQDNASALLFAYNAHFVIKFYKRKN